MRTRRSRRTWRLARPWTRRAATRSRTSMDDSSTPSSVPIPPWSGYLWRRPGACSRNSASPSASWRHLDLQQHVLRAWDRHRLRQRRVRPDDRERLLNLIGRDETVRQIESTRGRQTRGEVLGLTHHARRQLRCELARRGRPYALLGPLQRSRQGEEVAILGPAVGACEERRVHGAGPERLGDRARGSEVGEQLHPFVAEELRRHRLPEERPAGLPPVERRAE